MTATSAGEPLPGDAKVNCAICHLKAGLDVPPPVILPPRFVAELEFLIPAATAPGSFPLTPQLLLRSRGPPIV